MASPQQVAPGSTLTASMENALVALSKLVVNRARYIGPTNRSGQRCFDNTRVDVRNQILRWIISRDDSSKIMWMTGPAGTGKTAIARSIAESCYVVGYLGPTFFFSKLDLKSFCSSKYLVATLAYELTQHKGFDPVRPYILSAIKPSVFTKSLDRQIEDLILKPLRRVPIMDPIRASWPKAIVIDGLDECDVWTPPTPGLVGFHRSKDDEHLEILEGLAMAARDPAFPFRIFIASRPEPAIAQFFETSGQDISTKLVLDESRNPNVNEDMAHFLRAMFMEIRRRLPDLGDWPGEEIIQSLVRRASGQFIYVQTIKAFLMKDTHAMHPVPALKRVVSGLADGGVNPFAALDEFYAPILKAAPHPDLAVLWIHAINSDPLKGLPASFLKRFLGSDVDTAQQEHILGSLRSLISIPGPRDPHAEYTLYHKDLLEFLNNHNRCGHLYAEPSTRKAFILERYMAILKSQSSFQLLSILDLADGHYR
ncbi:hypothetical protein DFP72DRAFT_178829 [Ephemerocybe angulata]|uniref:Nephrocystin 3-like N-terminal domain-containing protein n=1 Tax=Ephemerocybe angulata TaxID=980116 RepID=A0A8H6M7G4_9AGAR|nr:hypothetical protein DFP72DRAFT_178829 [Tulosesus angulatus]